MKKFIICILLCAALVPSVFARSEDDDYDYREKVVGITPGVRLSILGLEPTLGLNISNLEIEGACALNTGWDGKQFGYAPSICSRFEREGWQVRRIWRGALGTHSEVLRRSSGAGIFSRLREFLWKVSGSGLQPDGRAGMAGRSF